MVKTLKGNIVSKSSKIIIGGCSFTDKDFPIINKRDMKIRYNRDVDLSDVKVWPEIIKEKTTYEVINLGVCGYDNSQILNSLLDEVSKHDSKEIAFVIAAWTEWPRNLKSNYVETTLNYMNTFDLYCINKEVDYRQIQMCNIKKEELFKDVVKHSMLYELDKSKIIGFPMFKLGGGFDGEDLIGNNIDKSEHPNKRGHEILAETILGSLK